MVFAASAAPLARVFLGFARFPAVRTAVDPAGVTTVRWTDVRFIGEGPSSRDRGGRPDLRALETTPGSSWRAFASTRMECRSSTAHLGP